jgi:hypothetical protein
MIKDYNYRTYSKSSIKDVQATEETFRPQKRTSSMKFRNFFLFLWVFFALLDRVSDPYPDPDLHVFAVI